MTDHPPAQADGATNGHLDDDALSAHLDAELDVDEASTAARHLEGCSFCRDRFGSLARAAELVGQVVEGPSPATRQRQLERALGLAQVRQLPDSTGRTRRQLALARWAAALLVVAGGGAAIWRFHADLGGGSSASSALTTTQVPAAHAAGGSAMLPLRLQLRALRGQPYRGCTPPSSSAPTPAVGAITLYDASDSASSGTPSCARLGARIATIDDATQARLVTSSHSPLASLILSLPASEGEGGSLLPAQARRGLAVVLDDEVIGYLSTSHGPRNAITIVRVPGGIARELTAELGSG